MSDPRLKVLARQTGLTSRELTRYIELDMVTMPRGEVSETTLHRVRRIHRLWRDLGIDLEVVAIIVRLLDRIEELEERERRAIYGHRDGRRPLPL